MGEKESSQLRLLGGVVLLSESPVRKNYIIPNPNPGRNFHSMFRKRAKYARTPRGVARIRTPVKSAIGARKVGGMTSQIDALSAKVGSAGSTGW